MEVQKIPLSLVFPSPMNPRKTFDEVELVELADNIEKQGLLQPITVRPVKHPNNEFNDRPDKYEIVCGERRYRACLILQEKWQDINAVAPDNRFDSILAIVREMNDDEAFEAMITENLQRKDVDPMEEAFAFGKLIDKGYTAEEIGARFGKSLRFVQDRVKLNSLIPELMVAVKDNKMSISAAMIIAKLSEEDQRRYANSYQATLNGYVKSTAESFINSLFMKIDRAPWYQTDNQADEDFADGCACKCSECQFNTANHGCLFWDMKNEDAGKCTDRERFNKKHIAFILTKLQDFKDRLIKVGEPLESGKMIIIDDSRYNSPYIQEIKKIAHEKIKSAGYEVVKPNDIFDGRCFYNNGDERLAEKKENGDVYCCLNIFDYDGVSMKEEYWYLKGKKEDSSTTETAATSEQSLDAMKLVQKRSRTKEIAREKLTEQLRALANKLGKAERKGDITENEQLAFDIAIFTLCGNKLLEKYGHEHFGKPSERSFVDVIKQNRADRSIWMREFVRNIIASADITYNRLYQHCAELVLEEWMPEEYNKIVKEISDKLDKDLQKNKEKLEALGYDTNGKLLPQPKEDVAKLIVEKLPKSSKPWEQFKAMKEKHPDAILLFRVSDFYEAFDKDAEDCAEILGITLTKRKEGKKEISIAGFPHHALNTYLPKIIRAGRRAAICEQLEAPKKKK